MCSPLLLVGRNQTENAERDEAAFGNDNVVEHTDADQLTDFHQSFGDGPVFLAGLRITARVIVHQDDAGSAVDDRRAENLAGMNDRSGQGPDTDRFNANRMLARIKQNGEKVLTLCAPQFIDRSQRRDDLGAGESAFGPGAVGPGDKFRNIPRFPPGLLPRHRAGTGGWREATASPYGPGRCCQ